MRHNLYLRAGALVAGLALALTACGGDGEPTAEDSPTPTAAGTPTDGAAAADLNLVSEGVLTVCTDAPYPPMEFEQDGEFTGFDIELMRAIAQEMGLDGIEVVNSGFDPIVNGTALASDQCDIAAASITITDEREENVDFTDPYFTADQSLLVKKDSDIQSLEDLAGQSLGVQSTTTGEMYAQENAPEGTEIVSFDDPGDLFTALEAGQIQGILQDIVVNQGRALEDDTVEVVETFPTDEEYGFAAEEGNQELVQAVNEALQALRDNGTYDQLFEEWFPNQEPSE